MSMEPVRNLSARATRARLMNPPGGRESSELEVIPRYMARLKILPLPIVTTPPPASTQDITERDRRTREAAFLEAWAGLATKNIRSVIMAAKVHFDRTDTELMSHRRTAAVVWPRHIVMHMARQYTTLSLPQIGQRLGGFDHTTVLHGVQRIAGLLKAGDKSATYDVAHMENLLGIR